MERQCNILLDFLTKDYSSIKLIIVQHLKSDTLYFIKILMTKSLEITYLLSKKYSHDEEIFNIFCELMIAHNFVENCSENDLLEIVSTTNSDCEKQNKKFIILDLGGIFSSVLKNNHFNNLLGIVEDTKYGHRLYQNYKYSFPIFSVAESEIKKIESRFVGKAIVDASDLLSKKVGKTISGKNILLVGYGLIGSNVAKHLLARGCKVFIKELSSLKILNAIFDGCEIYNDNYRRFDYIIGTTGDLTINEELLSHISSSEVILISGSSNTIEIDMQYLYKEANLTNEYEFIQTGFLANKKIRVFYNGMPINFLIGSVAEEIIELIFCEIIQNINHILDYNIIGYSSIGYSSIEDINKISDAYLKQRNI